MNKEINKIEKFELHHKILVFVSVMFATILLTRGLTLIKDPNIFIGTYELHHFYYGIILLTGIVIFMLFNKKHYLTCLILSSISIGLILDEFLFIFGKMENIIYPQTFVSALLFACIIWFIAVIVKKYKV